MNNYLLIEDILSESECLSYQQQIDAILTTNESFDTKTNVYDRARIPNKKLSDIISIRLKKENISILPKDFTINPLWFYTKYPIGGNLNSHIDGNIFGNDTISIYSIIIYLNDDFSGGTTKFLDDNHKVIDKIIPKKGVAAIINQNALHRAALVRKGSKYILRSDIMVPHQTA